LVERGNSAGKQRLVSAKVLAKPGGNKLSKGGNKPLDKRHRERSIPLRP
jgi:hypothetical protein